ncbi:unnamed protein product [Adineta ricciae]|uniref:G-protein coupled receptors family 1 profile domain-containing protein n=1 Tax=Adineta ricciae TaxID=249248 RepID=A0A815GQZ8_ADIRI|nr:unnamed protein product [Adineta ricciae]CAF1341422.1 unnamed protein product [Adineta ricciae]
MSTSLILLIHRVSDTYELYSYSVLLIIGMISNFLNATVFLTFRPFRVNQCAFYFAAESIANIGLFLVIFPLNIYYRISNIDLTHVSLCWCKMEAGLSGSFGLCSLYAICFQTIDQYLATNPRPSFRQISTMKLARRSVLCIACFAILHNIPLIITSEIQESGSCSVSNDALQTYNAVFYYPVLCTALPLLTTITFSFLAYRNVRRIVRRQMPVVRRRLDRQMTVMVLARTVNLILLGLPYVIYNIYTLNLRDIDQNQLEEVIVGLVGLLAYSLLYLNFAVNFYLFLIVSTRFRRQVKHGIMKKCCAKCYNFHPSNRRRHSRNQVVPETALRQVSGGVESA